MLQSDLVKATSNGVANRYVIFQEFNSLNQNKV